MRRIILDTSVLVGVMVLHDKRHAAAVSAARTVLADDVALVLDCVYMEAVAVLIRKCREKYAGLGREVFESESRNMLTRLRSTYPSSKVIPTFTELGSHHEEVVGLCLERPGLSYVDSWLCLWAHREAVEYILSLDRGFDSVPWVRRLA